MQQVLLIIHVLIAICIVGLVLIQHGKGADVGAAFGSGGSNTMFGSQGSMSFLFKLTMGLAFLFFAISIMLNYIVNHSLKMQRTSLVAPTKTINTPAGSRNAQRISIPVGQRSSTMNSEKQNTKTQNTKTQ